MNDQSLAARAIGAFAAIVLEGIPDAEFTARRRAFGITLGVSVIRDRQRWTDQVEVLFRDLADAQYDPVSRAAEGIVYDHMRRWPR